MDVLDDLRRELNAVSPSPAFAAGVRARIDSDVSTTGLLRWSWWAAVGVAAALVIAIGVWRAGRTASVPDSAVSTPAIVRVETPATAAATPPLARVDPRVEIPRARVTRAARIPPSEPNAGTAASSSPEPTLEVITNQPQLLREMWARASRPSAASQRAAVSDSGIDDAAPGSIEVNPVVVKWLIEPPQAPVTFPIIRRIAAAEIAAERSAK
jgi:hypothetical protein